MSKDLEILNNDDVVSVFKHDAGRFASGDTFKVQQLLMEYEGYIAVQTKTTNNSEICTQGIECQVLRQDNNSKGWRKGKIKFVIQFEPDEAVNSVNSNSLDDIRHRINTPE